MSNGRRPRVLYKYISSKALDSIFGKSELKWTRADCLDDPSESEPGRITYMDWPVLKGLIPARVQELASPNCTERFLEDNALAQDFKRIRSIKDQHVRSVAIAELVELLEVLQFGWSKDFAKDIQGLVEKVSQRYVCSMSESADSQPLWSS